MVQQTGPAEQARVLGIIPARKGSKRVIGKNIKPLCGKPLIAYTFEVAKQAIALHRLIVSTNDEAVLALAKEYGLEAPFVRPDEFATDTATDFDWIHHAVQELQKSDWHPTYVVILRPTQPLRRPEDVNQAVQKIIAHDFDSVRSLTKVTAHPYWMKRLEGDLALPFLDLGVPEEKLRSQDLPSLYRLNGIVDVINVRNLQENGRTGLYGQTMGYILIDEDQSVDIDTERDFRYAEFLLKEGLFKF